MLPQRLIEGFVGLFLVFALISISILAFKVSGLTTIFPAKGYTITASFEDIGGLKVRSPVKIGGVQVGEVMKIFLDQVTFRSMVVMKIQEKYSEIPDDSSVGILTSGLLGDNYVAITPMYSKTFLKNGSQIQNARSAMVLEKLIGQFIYKLGNSNSDSASEDKNINSRT
jgi:phospholipid/cholesterol/gamma-HCH transport system substrate-binding protein